MRDMFGCWEKDRSSVCIIALHCTALTTEPDDLLNEELFQNVLSTFRGQLQQPELWSFSPVPLRVHVAEIKT